MDESEKDLDRTTREQAHKAFRRAVAIVGSQAAFAPIAGVTQQYISKLLSKRRLLPLASVPAVSEATGISRHDLRPDIYPREDSPAHPPAEAPTPSTAGGPPSAHMHGLEGLKA